MIDIGNIAPPDVLHHPADAGRVLRGDKDVNVVGHQHIGVDGAVIAFCRFFQPPPIRIVVVVFKEHRFPAMPALDNVDGYIR